MLRNIAFAPRLVGFAAEVGATNVRLWHMGVCDPGLEYESLFRVPVFANRILERCRTYAEELGLVPDIAPAVCRDARRSRAYDGPANLVRPDRDDDPGVAGRRGSGPVAATCRRSVTSARRLTSPLANCGAAPSTDACMPPSRRASRSASARTADTSSG